MGDIPIGAVPGDDEAKGLYDSATSAMTIEERLARLETINDTSTTVAAKAVDEAIRLLKEETPAVFPALVQLEVAAKALSGQS